VVVAMIDDEVRQTRCSTCDADHEYKQARAPVLRRKKPSDAVPAPGDHPLPMPVRASAAPAHDETEPDPLPETPFTAEPEAQAGEAEADRASLADDDGPVHRRLIRATLPRPEGQVPERKAPDFTLRQQAGRFDQGRNGGRQRGRPQQAQAHGASGVPPHARSPGGRSGRGPVMPQGQRSGNRPGGDAAGSRGSRPPGPSRGQRPGGGHGRKRGR
jgi:hypothetical protein